VSVSKFIQRMKIFMFYYFVIKLFNIKNLFYYNNKTLHIFYYEVLFKKSKPTEPSDFHQKQMKKKKLNFHPKIVKFFNPILLELILLDPCLPRDISYQKYSEYR
jgi:hypothetical protein